MAIRAFGGNSAKLAAYMAGLAGRGRMGCAQAETCGGVVETLNGHGLRKRRARKSERHPRHEPEKHWRQSYGQLCVLKLDASTMDIDPQLFCNR